MSKVSFLVAGVQKGGTTAIRRYLRAVPGLSVPAPELHFFDDESQDWASIDADRYEASFAGDDGVRGEVTPIYSYWPGALERAARYRPDMKIILLLRDRVARAWSHWRMEHHRGADAAPFAWAIREGRARVTADPASCRGAHRVYSYVERGCYAPQVAQALRLFGRERVLLLRSADLRSDPAAVLAAVATFLGVAPPQRPVSPQVVRPGSHVAPSFAITDQDVALLRSLYAEDEAAFVALTGLHLPPEPLR